MYIENKISSLSMSTFFVKKLWSAEYCKFQQKTQLFTVTYLLIFFKNTNVKLTVRRRVKSRFFFFNATWGEERKNFIPEHLFTPEVCSPQFAPQISVLKICSPNLAPSCLFCRLFHPWKTPLNFRIFPACGGQITPWKYN